MKQLQLLDGHDVHYLCYVMCKGYAHLSRRARTITFDCYPTIRGRIGDIVIPRLQETPSGAYLLLLTEEELAMSGQSKTQKSPIGENIVVENGKVTMIDRYPVLNDVPSTLADGIYKVDRPDMWAPVPLVTAKYTYKVYMSTGGFTGSEWCNKHLIPFTKHEIAIGTANKVLTAMGYTEEQIVNGERANTWIPYTMQIPITGIRKYINGMSFAYNDTQVTVLLGKKQRTDIGAQVMNARHEMAQWLADRLSRITVTDASLVSTEDVARLYDDVKKLATVYSRYATGDCYIMPLFKPDSVLANADHMTGYVISNT